uniref:Exocyst complex component 7 n=1 Tax=Caenorhabditis japonica TaxID=281687 RepID=A0A8R1DWJ1_CAEJA
MTTDGNAAESIAKKLAQEEEWLQNFQKNIAKSAQIRQAIEQVVDKFDQRLGLLEKNVLPMHISNGQLQKKQHNIQRLINTIDATLQFYGKTNTVENAIRDGNPHSDLNAYLENMECLQQAINFFETHPNYASQTENMKMTLDTGFTILEKAYKSILLKNSVTVDPKLFLKTNDQGELSPRTGEIKIINDEEPIVKIGVWLLKQHRVHFLSHYSDIRGNQILKNIKNIAEEQKLMQLASRSKISTVRKPIQRSEKVEALIEVDACHVMCSSLLTLLELEEKLMVKAIPDTSRRAQVFRELVSRPLTHAIIHTQKVINERDIGIIPLLPLLHVLSQNYARFHNLATNSIGDVQFDLLMRQLQVKCSSYVNEAIEKLNEDTTKFVPPDGNVHPTTASTLNFLSSLTVHRVTVTEHVLALTAPQGQNTTLLLPKLFARILSALGSMLKKKANLYDDPTLATIFLLNNYNYIAKTLADEKDGLLPAITEMNANILSFYHEEIATCTNEYLKSWNGIAAILKSVDRIGEDKAMAKSIMNTFVRDFEQVLAQQTDYCISDPAISSNVQSQVKARIWKNYSQLLDTCQRLHVFPQGIKYTENTFEMAIQNLFSSAKIH